MSNRFINTLANILNKRNRKYSIEDISLNELCFLQTLAFSI